jgi:hypothetical protein
MRKVFFAIILLFMSSLLSFSEEEAITTTGKRVLLKDDGTWVRLETSTISSSTDFRNTKWGMSLQEVMSVEKIAKSDIKFQSASQFAITATVASYPCFIYYIFAFDKLVRAVYVFNITHTNKTDFVNVDFPKVRDSLITKYGKPAEDEQYWKDDLYKDDPSDWGMAVAVGHLQLYALWQTSSTHIVEYLSGDNFDISLRVEYSSLQLGNLETEERTQTESKDF